MSRPMVKPSAAIVAISATPDINYRWNRKNRSPSPLILDFHGTEFHLADHFGPSTTVPVKTENKVSGPRSLTTEEWLDSVEAAAYLKVSLGALRNMTSNGQIPFYKMGKRNRYRTEELRQLLLSQKRGASNGN